MNYSAGALDLQSLPLKALPRLEDRFDFIHLDRCRIEQTSTGIEIWSSTDSGENVRFTLPYSSLSVVTLGPGCSITTPALATLSRAGASVLFTDASGMVAYSQARPLAINSKMARSQALLYSDPSKRIEVAKQMYSLRFGDFDQLGDNVTLRQLRGLEGSRVRASYKRLSSEFKTGKFLRNTKSDDPVNLALNISNSILYGMALSVCSAFSLNPALGFIHEGTTSALLYDIADIYKLETSVPASFRAAKLGDPLLVRKMLRKQLESGRYLQRMIKDVSELLKIQTDPLFEEDDRILDDKGFVPGHTNWDLV